MQRGNSSWFLSTPSAESKAQVICFPPAGSGASFFATWQKQMPKSIAIRAVQLPGREQRYNEEPYRDLDALVDELKHVLSEEIDQPFVLLGHSFGAVLATLLARALEPTVSSAYLKGLVASGLRPLHLAHDQAPISHLDSTEFLLTLRDRYRAVPDMVLQNVEMRNIYLPVLRADFTMLENRPVMGPFELNCPVIAFGGRQDTPQTERLEEWRLYTKMSFRSYLIDGDHFFPKTNRSAFLGLLRRELSDLLAVDSPE